MAMSNEWWDYHLTPRGWEDGSCKVDFGGYTDRPIPPDRVLTVRYSEYQSSMYGRADRGYNDEWQTGRSPFNPNYFLEAPMKLRVRATSWLIKKLLKEYAEENHPGEWTSATIVISRQPGMSAELLVIQPVKKKARRRIKVTA